MFKHTLGLYRVLVVIYIGAQEAVHASKGKVQVRMLKMAAKNCGEIQKYYRFRKTHELQTKARNQGLATLINGCKNNMEHISSVKTAKLFRFDKAVKGLGGENPEFSLPAVFLMAEYGTGKMGI
ncbi:unnamed protein product [Dibothriocephalus latus]|uniref:Uncharacterized protein n=1 Tax=Dibothriocephalus latus TaxID=60516 RepID=A0A3P7LW26_DIBLA|nr:unnamed protein product [Dibothriocephalus latus]